MGKGNTMNKSEEKTAGAVRQSMEDEYKKRLDRIEAFCMETQAVFQGFEVVEIAMRQIIGMTKGAYNEGGDDHA